MNRFFFLGVMLFSCYVGILLAQNPYIREGSIGTQKSEKDTSEREAFTFLPIESWVGEKFIFLPRRKGLQKYGYRSFKGGGGKYGCPTYEECVGRIGTVVEVFGTGDILDVILIKMTDNNQVYSGEATLGSIPDIMPIADLDSARARWLGKTLWYKTFHLSTYNEESDEEGSIWLERKYVPVKVIDIVAGWDDDSPVRFIIRTKSEEEGFIDVKVGNTNIGDVYRDADYRSFESRFLTEDPRITYKWSNEVWSAIEKAKVFVGMTAQQARMSWGEPKEINRTSSASVKQEQWVYGDGNYLYFDNGILTSIQH